MSGGRLRNPRQGDRSEYLATYLLSALGLTTNVPRQEDIGFDFHCVLADQEGGLLTFGFPFLVQAKSAGDPVFELLPPEKYEHPARQIPRHLLWLFRQELPLYLGVIDKDLLSLRLYSLAPLWFIYFEGHDCAGIRFVPRNAKSPTGHVGRPVRGAEIAPGAGAFIYDIDVGYPIAELNATDAQSNERVAEEKTRLRRCIDFEMRNLVFFRAGLPHFYWFVETDRAKGRPWPAFYYRELVKDDGHLKRAYSFLGPALIPLARRFQLDGNVAGLEALKVLFAGMPAETIPDEIKAALPEVFPKAAK